MRFASQLLPQLAFVLRDFLRNLDADQDDEIAAATVSVGQAMPADAKFLTLVGAGGKHELGKFGRPEHQRFDRLIGIVRLTVSGHLDTEQRQALTL